MYRDIQGFTHICVREIAAFHRCTGHIIVRAYPYKARAKVQAMSGICSFVTDFVTPKYWNCHWEHQYISCIDVSHIAMESLLFAILKRSFPVTRINPFIIILQIYYNVQAWPVLYVFCCSICLLTVKLVCFLLWVFQRHREMATKWYWSHCILSL